MRVGLFDLDGKEIFAYPDKLCDYCNGLRSNKKIETLCKSFDNKAFEYVKKHKKTYCYYCHKGLIEAVAPICKNGEIICYLMFGQVRGQHSPIKENASFNAIPAYSENEINAYVSILEALCSHVINNNLVMLSPESAIEKMSELYEENRFVSVSDICLTLNLSRATLYRKIGNVSAVLRDLKINRSCDLLKNTHLCISRVAELSGFYDYNYFCKVFKKYKNMSPTVFRKEYAKA